MQPVMTNEEMVAAARLDDYAKSRAGLLGERASHYSNDVVDALRLFVCEMAYQRYVPFAEKFGAGNAETLRKLLNECWDSIRAGEPFPKVEVIKSKIDGAEFDDADWDHPIASDAVSALCIIDACLICIDERPVCLSNGIELLLGNSIKKMIDACAESGGDLNKLTDAIESGAVLVPEDELIVEILEHVADFESTKLFSDWLRVHQATRINRVANKG